MKVYKLTDENMQTHNGFQWEIGKWVGADGSGELCGPGWLHAYEHPLLAVLHNPIHADFMRPRLFEAWTGNGKIRKDGQMKLGSTKIKLVREIPLPKVTLTQNVAYGILCALAVYDDATFVSWAENWLSGKDRTARAARAAAAAAAAWAARAAEAERAADMDRKLDLIAIAEKAMGY